VIGSDARVKLSLGPIQYYWPRERVFDFYREIERAPVDIVYLGETVCAKRRALRLEDWLAIAERLTAAGKEVVLSTLALIEAESEVAGLRRAIENGAFAIEANDVAALGMARGKPFVCGPHVNVYNGEALALMRELGAYRWVAPFELPRATIETLIAARPAGLEVELLAFGRLPLAFSARCFTARAYNLPKDNCGFRCGDHPDGMPLRTQEGEPFLTLNGIQVQSSAVYNLIGDADLLRSLGVDVLRLSPIGSRRGPRAEKEALLASLVRPATRLGAVADSPLPEAMGEVIALFSDVLAGARPARAAAGEVARLVGGATCDGYWHGQPGMIRGGDAAP
jgi:collagenase-like PrtC family protease